MGKRREGKVWKSVGSKTEWASTTKRPIPSLKWKQMALAFVLPEAEQALLRWCWGCGFSGA